MKKLWVALASIFIFLAGITFSACGKVETTLSVNSKYEEICINSNLDDSEKVAYITARVQGESGQVVVDTKNSPYVFCNTEEISKNAAGETIIPIHGQNEGQAVVRISAYDDLSIYEEVTINVYSDILGMSKKTDEEVAGNSPFYALQGDSVTLDWQTMLNFSAETREDCRKDIVWEFAEGFEYDQTKLQINGNTLSVASDYPVGSRILVTAKSAHNANVFSDVIGLTVIQPIKKSDIQLLYSTSSNAGQAYNPSSDEAIRIIPNPKKTSVNQDAVLYEFAYLTVKVKKYADLNQPEWEFVGNNAHIIEGGRDGREIGTAQDPDGTQYSTYTYVYNANTKEQEHINSDTAIYFYVKYKDFAYTAQTDPINFAVYEQITDVQVTTQIGDSTVFQQVDGNSAPQAIYTSYIGQGNATLGKEYRVTLIPDSAVFRTRKFKVRLTYPTLAEHDENEITNNTIELSYVNRRGEREKFTFNAEPDGFDASSSWFTSTNEFDPALVSSSSANQAAIYIRASGTDVKTSISGVKIEFISSDNEYAVGTVMANLFHSVENNFSFKLYDQDIEGADKEIKENSGVYIDSSLDGDQARVKRLLVKVNGQNSISGFKVIHLGGEGFEVRDIAPISNNDVPAYVGGVNDDQVCFYIDIAVTSVGYTSESAGSIKLVHENGAESSPISVSLYAPFESFTFAYDSSTGSGDVASFNSNTNYPESQPRNNIYKLDVLEDSMFTTAQQFGEPYGSDEMGLFDLIAKTPSSIPLTLSTNRVGQFNAIAPARYYFLDKQYFEAMKNSLSAEQLANVFGAGGYEFETLTPQQIFNAIKRLDLGGVKDGQDEINPQLSRYFEVDRNSLHVEGDHAQTWIMAAYSGYAKNHSPITLFRFVRVESYVAIGATSILVDNQPSRTVRVYAQFSNSEENTDVHKKVSISLSSNPYSVTYNDFSNYSFSANEQVAENLNTNLISFANGTFQISNVTFPSDGKHIEFTIDGLNTFGAPSVANILTINYTNEKTNEINVPIASINVNVISSVRIENVTWASESDEGLYFDLRKQKQSFSQTITVRTYPENVRDDGLTYKLTDVNGNDADFVDVQPIGGRGVVSLNASNKAGKGYIYVLPNDAHYGDLIYYILASEEGKMTSNGITLEGDDEKYTVRTMSLANIGIRNGSTNLTGYEYLCQNAYFVNNDNQAIPFADILLRVPVTVADGASFETAYRLYSSADFAEMEAFSYYLVMNSVVLTDWKGIDNFNGGIQGFEGRDVTITLNGNSNSFVQTLGMSEQSDTDKERGVIQNLTFAGQVTGSGFVADRVEKFGVMRNVTVDVNIGQDSITSSSVSASGDYAGGVVGVNLGKLENISSLGVTVTGANIAGGLVGQNAGSIEGSRFEIYNFASGANTITGTSIASGFVGEIVDGSIKTSFAYDYTLASNNTAQNLKAQTTYAFASYKQSENANVSVEQCFAVVNVDDFINDFGKEVDCYNSYYKSGTTYTSDMQQTNTDNWMRSGSAGFNAEINGGKDYLKAVSQALPLTSQQLASAQIKTFADGGSIKYYHSLNVMGDNAILFYYDIASPVGRDLVQNNDNYSSDKNALLRLNTIMLSNLFDSTIADRIIVTSSDINKVDVATGSLVVKGNGVITLTISSRQDFTQTKPITVDVIYSMSDLSAIWSRNNQPLANNASVSVQRGAQTTLSYSQANENLAIGNLGNTYQMATNGYKYKTLVENAESTEGTILPELNVDEDNIITDNNDLLITTDHNTYERTIFNTSAYLPFEEIDTTIVGGENEDTISRRQAFVNAVAQNFKHGFTLNLVKGTVSLDITQATMTITPSDNSTVDAHLVTYDENAEIQISITNGTRDVTLRKLTSSIDSILVFGLNEDNPMIEVRKTQIGETTTNEENGQFTKNYQYLFSVAPDYKSKVANTEDYVVTFTAGIENYSQSKQMPLQITSQEFYHLDINTYKTYGQANDGVVRFKLNYAAKTSVLRPGEEALVVVDISPEYAYYDSVRLAVGGNPTVNTYRLSYMNAIGNPTQLEDGQEYVRVERFNSESGITVSQKPTGIDLRRIVFKIIVDSYVSQDATLALNIYFYRGNEIVEHGTTYIGITYLAPPTITIDGQNDNALLARGSSVEVRIETNADQAISIDYTTVRSVRKGIYLQGLNNAPVTNPLTGRKVYSLELVADIDAEVLEDARDVFQVLVRITRTYQGVQDYSDRQINVRLVDFKIDTNNIAIANEEGNLFIAREGMNKSLNFVYNFIPEEYRYINTTGEAKAEELKANRVLLNEIGAYPQNVDANTLYSINYRYDGNGQLRLVPLKERIEFLRGDQWIPIYSEQNGFTTECEGYSFSSVTDGNGKEQLMVTALNHSGYQTRFRLTTYIQNGSGDNNIARTHFEFLMECRAFSSESLAMPIWNEEGFRAALEGEPQDYILMNNLHLTNWKLDWNDNGDTTGLRSLDGNGYTIYIENFDLSHEENESDLDLALFGTINEETTIKNLVVNVYSAGQLVIDVSRQGYSDIQIAGFAIENNGIITNCDVQAFYYEPNLAQPKHHNSHYSSTTKLGFNVKYVEGEGSSSDTFLGGTNTAGEVNAFTSEIAAFVIDNNGAITNSRVGANAEDIILYDDRVIVQDEDTGLNVGVADISDSVTAFTLASLLGANTAGSTIAEVREFNVIGQGDISGFVLRNNTQGKIASCYSKNLSMQNRSKTNTFTAGFAGENDGYILSSYIEGLAGTTEGAYSDPYCKQGTMLASDMGTIAGFVYSNNENGVIKDAYSNIFISNDRAENFLYLASGFVYQNQEGGLLENCYSASQVQRSKTSQMNFTGVSVNTEPLNYGTYTNCYYYCSTQYTTGQNVEGSYTTGAKAIVGDVSDKNYFYGFAFASNEGDDGVWDNSNETGPVLVEPNQITVSHRIYQEWDDSHVLQENEKEYYLAYAKVTVSGLGRTLSTEYGGLDNPIIIRTAQEFNSVMGASTDSDISLKFTDKTITGNYRLVTNIDLDDLLVVDEEGNQSAEVFNLTSTSRSFTGRLAGNGFTISNLSISQGQRALAFGMFISIERATLINFNLSIRSVTSSLAYSVGGLAGIIYSSRIVNVDISFADSTLNVDGGNFAGALAGIVVGDTRLKAISVTDAYVISEKNDIDPDEESVVYDKAGANALRSQFANYLGIDSSSYTTVSQLSTDKINNLTSELGKHSYAGGLVGFANIDTSLRNSNNDGYATSLKSLADFDFVTLRGYNSIRVEGQVVGGLIGYQGQETYIMDAGINITPDATVGETDGVQSYIVAKNFYAGGVIGQATSALKQIFAEHDLATQDAIEENIYSHYSGDNNIGITNLFDGTDAAIYQHKAIGGLVGYATSGSLLVSYSRLNVTSNNALYAGGAIGLVDTSAEMTNQYEYDNNIVKSTTSYLLNEVYATGDVRAKFWSTSTEGLVDGGYTGGIIGGIIENSRVAMMSVNAMNMMTLNNYATNGSTLAPTDIIDTEMKEAGSSISTYNFAGQHIYALVGRFVATTPDENGSLDRAKGSNLFIAQKANATTSSSDDDEEDAGKGNENISVYIIRNYQFETNNVFFSPYPGYEIDVRNAKGIKKEEAASYTYDDTIRANNVGYVLNYGDAQMSNIEAGYRLTSAYFLRANGVWTLDNWNHQPSMLYPRIKYTLAGTSYQYLDAYDESIKQTINAVLQNPSVEIRVRGRLSETTSECGDIDLASYIDRIDPNKEGSEMTPIININYMGRMIYNNAWSNGEDISIILSRPLFNSGENGATIDGVNFKFQLPDGLSKTKTLYDEVKKAQGTTQSSVSGYGGGIFQGTFVNGTIHNVKIEIYTPMYLDLSNKAGGDDTQSVGLIASYMANSTVSDVHIYDQVSENAALLTAVASGERDEVTGIGLIAGTFALESFSQATPIGSISNISFHGNDGHPAALIDVVTASGAEKNVGLMFGSFLQNAGQMESFDIGSISDLDANHIISITTGASPNVNVGGNIGSIKYNKHLTISAGALGFINLNGTFGDINAGGAIGQLDDSALLTVKPLTGEYDGDYEVRGHIKGGNGTSCTKAYLGGIVGQTMGQMTMESGIDVDFYIGSSSSDGNSVNTGEKYITSAGENGKIATGLIDSSEETYVGGYAGYVEDVFTVSGGTAANNATKINEGYQVLGASGNSGTKHIGGMAGKCHSNVSITGTFICNANLYASGERAYLGGLVGEIYSDGTIVNVTIGKGGNVTTDQSILINAPIISSASEVHVGGVAGNIRSQEANVSNTIYAGPIKLSGTTLTAGGTVGVLYTDISGNKTLEDNITFGDVFVSSESLSSYHYGGIIGYVNRENSVTASNNLTLMTNHNTVANTTSAAYAMFGEGTIEGSGNCYNHAVCMASDTQAHDIAYMTTYSGEVRGYRNSKRTVVTHDNMINLLNGKFKDNALLNEFRDSEGNFIAGTKLNPIAISISDGTSDKGISDKDQDANDLKNENGQLNAVRQHKTNGIIYYYLTGDENVTVSDSDNTNQSIFNTENKNKKTLTDTAIIGDSFTLGYNVTADTNNGKIASLISNMDGYSFISGLNLNLSLHSETLKTETQVDDTYYFGGLVDTMKGNSKIFSVGVTGSVDVGGANDYITIGAMVGKVEETTNAAIENSNSSANVVYRGTNGGDKASTISGLIGETKSKLWLQDDYTAGITKTYTKIKGYAVTTGDKNIITTQNCYTIARIHVDDVTSADGGENLDASNVVAVGVTYSFTKSSEFGGSTAITDAKLNVPDVDNCLGTWAAVLGLNYNYPIHANYYTHASSWYVPGDVVEELKRTETGKTELLPESIERKEYSRMPTNTMTDPTKAQEGKFYGIPNAERLKTLQTGDAKQNAEVTNYVIVDDIDYAASNTNAKDDTATQSRTVTIDGAGHAIKNQTFAIYSSITNTKIKNLRLVDVNISSGNSTLADSATGCPINYVTAQGTLGASSGNVGGIIGSATNCQIYNASNLVAITTTGGSAVGGIVGNLTGGTIAYSSNNATIIGKAQNVGGIVGNADSSKINIIKQSHNIAGIAVGYNEAYGTATSVGGIAGTWAGAEGSSMESVYNGGTIRVGTKQTAAMQYVGGIAGQIKTKIDGAYNEGSVEGRSKTVWTFVDDQSGTVSDTGDFREFNGTKITDVLTLKQGKQYLAVYGIGYVNGGSVANYAVAPEVDIVANGNAFGSNHIIYAWVKKMINSGNGEDDRCVVYEDQTIGLTIGSQQVLATGMGYYSVDTTRDVSVQTYGVVTHKVKDYARVGFNSSNKVETYSKDDVGVDSKDGEGNPVDKRIQILSYNNYGFPKSIEFQHVLFHEIRIDSANGFDTGSRSKPNTYEETAGYYNWTSLLLGMQYDCAKNDGLIINNSTDKGSFGGNQATVNNILNVNNEITGNKDKEILVSGKTYKIVYDSKAFSDAISSSVQKYTVTVPIPDSLPKLGNASYYSVSQVTPDENILQIRVLGYENSTNSLQVEIATKEEMKDTASLQLSVSVSFSESKTVDFTNAIYAFNPADNTITIDASKITDENGEEINWNIVKDCRNDDEEYAKYQFTKNGETINLIYNNGYLIYRPSDNGNKIKAVEDLQGQYSTKFFSNQSVTLSAEQYILQSDNSGSQDISAPEVEKKDGSGSKTFGTSEKSLSDLEMASTTQIGEYGFEYTISGYRKDAYATIYYEDGETRIPFASFDNQNKKWNKGNLQEISDKLGYTITIEDNAELDSSIKGMFAVTDPAIEIDQYSEVFEDFYSKLKIYYESDKPTQDKSLTWNVEYDWTPKEGLTEKTFGNVKYKFNGQFVADNIQAVVTSNDVNAPKVNATTTSEGQKISVMFEAEKYIEWYDEEGNIQYLSCGDYNYSVSYDIVAQISGITVTATNNTWVDIEMDDGTSISTKSNELDKDSSLDMNGNFKKGKITLSAGYVEVPKVTAADREEVSDEVYSVALDFTDKHLEALSLSFNDDGLINSDTISFEQTFTLNGKAIQLVVYNNGNKEWIETIESEDGTNQLTLISYDAAEDKYYKYDYLAETENEQEQELGDDTQVTGSTGTMFSVQTLKDQVDKFITKIHFEKHDGAYRLYFMGTLPEISTTTITQNYTSSSEGDITIPAPTVTVVDNLTLDFYTSVQLSSCPSLQDFSMVNKSITFNYMPDNAGNYTNYRENSENNSRMATLDLSYNGQQNVTTAIPSKSQEGTLSDGIILGSNMDLGVRDAFAGFVTPLLGDKHMIKYATAGDSLVSTIETQTQYIRDTFFAGIAEGYYITAEHGLLAQTNHAKFSNVAIYGSIRNVSNSVASGAFDSNSGTFNNTKVNVSLNSHNGYSIQDIVGVANTTTTDLSGLTYSGILVAGNGAEGMDGAKGWNGIRSLLYYDYNISIANTRENSYEVRRAQYPQFYGEGSLGSEAESAKNGGNIYMFTKLANGTTVSAKVGNAIIKAGDGGAAGHDGDSGKGVDLYEILLIQPKFRDYKLLTKDGKYYWGSKELENNGYSRASLNEHLDVYNWNIKGNEALGIKVDTEFMYFNYYNGSGGTETIAGYGAYILYQLYRPNTSRQLFYLSGIPVGLLSESSATRNTLDYLHVVPANVTDPNSLLSDVVKVKSDQTTYIRQSGIESLSDSEDKSVGGSKGEVKDKIQGLKEVVNYNGSGASAACGSRDGFAGIYCKPTYKDLHRDYYTWHMQANDILVVKRNNSWYPGNEVVNGGMTSRKNDDRRNYTFNFAENHTAEISNRHSADATHQPEPFV